MDFLKLPACRQITWYLTLSTFQVWIITIIIKCGIVIFTNSFSFFLLHYYYEGADQVDVDIHLASQLAMNSLARGRLLRQRNIPTISVDSEASDVRTSNPVTRRVSFSSLASRAGSFSLSQSSHMYDNVDNYWENDTTYRFYWFLTNFSIFFDVVVDNRATVENNEYITSKIHQLVCAFADRAQYLKERISQPLSPSTGSPSKGMLLHFSLFLPVFNLPVDFVGSPEPPPLERSISLLSCSDAGNKDGVLFLSGNWKLPATFHPQSKDGIEL